jgi:hypothetical protein
LAFLLLGCAVPTGVDLADLVALRVRPDGVGTPARRAIAAALGAGASSGAIDFNYRSLPSVLSNNRHRQTVPCGLNGRATIAVDNASTAATTGRWGILPEQSMD